MSYIRMFCCFVCLFVFEVGHVVCVLFWTLSLENKEDDDDDDDTLQDFSTKQTKPQHLH